MTTVTTTTITTSADGRPPQAPVPKWISGHQCPKVEYNPTSEYKLKKGEKTGYGVVCQYTTRAQRDMNAIYVGGLDERTPEGYGEWHSEEEGLSYHGGWKNGLASGYGKFTDSWTTDWPDSWARFLPGDAESTAKIGYIGGFKEGYFHGWGELTFKDKSRYEGSWKDGRRWGYGKYIKDDGFTVEFQPDGYVKPEPKKEEKHDEHKHDKPASPQYIYVQPAQPQFIQPVIQAPGPQIPQFPNEHKAQAGVSLTWGHGVQPPSPPQPGYLYSGPQAQPQGLVEIPFRPSTPQPIPVQFTVGGSSRPTTPQPGRHNSQPYPGQPLASPPAGGPGLPYPPDVNSLSITETVNISGSPPPNPVGNPFFGHM
jgi:hypothetical protein